MAGATLMKLLPSRRVLCTPYSHALCHFMQSHIRKEYACLAVTCHLHFWQDVFEWLAAQLLIGWSARMTGSPAFDWLKCSDDWQPSLWLAEVLGWLAAQLLIGWSARMTGSPAFDWLKCSDDWQPSFWLAEVLGWLAAQPLIGWSARMTGSPAFDWLKCSDDWQPSFWLAEVLGWWQLRTLWYLGTLPFLHNTEPAHATALSECVCVLLFHKGQTVYKL